jgi:hypothetical protein
MQRQTGRIATWTASTEISAALKKAPEGAFFAGRWNDQAAKRASMPAFTAVNSAGR